MLMLASLPVAAQEYGMNKSPAQYDTIRVASVVCKTPGKIILTRAMLQPFYVFQRPERQPFLTVHGNVQYDFLYRSLVDTPFSQKDFTQHTVQATLDFVFRNKYPFRLVISNRSSNSPYFRDITDVNFQFSKTAFMNRLKEQIAGKLPDLLSKYNLPELENLYKKKKLEITGLQDWLHRGNRLQEMVEEKEAAIRRKQEETGEITATTAVPNTQDLKQQTRDVAAKKINNFTDSILNETDTLARNSASSKYLKQKETLEKSLAELKEYEQKLTRLKKLAKDSAAGLKQELAQITDPARLKEFMRDHQFDTKELPKGWKSLTAISNLGIGRTWVDYSELTVKNISLTGINAELNPSKLYFAFAAGRVNYRFRDFVIKNDHQPKQNLYLVRAGIGKKEGNNLIATWYDGKKSLLNSFNTPTDYRLERVMGFSVQTRLQADANHYIILESAKSSFHNNPAATPVNGLMKRVWNFNDRSNEAYSIKIYNHWPKKNTKISGYYRKMGEHFQSFTLQPINVTQEAYQFGVQQSFWKRKLTVDAGVRKNDFSNPLINPGIASKTVFKSVQLSLRVPKYPFLSVGYYPSSQLTVLDNNVIAENQYNTLSAVASYAFRVKKISMSSSFVFLKFYNNGADTGFIYYNASSYTASHFIFLKNLELQTGVTVTSQQNLNVFTLEQSLNLQVKKWLSLNGALKYNRLNNEETLWGGTTGLGIFIKQIGTIQASYDKSYLPGTGRNLLPADMGRVTYYRTF